MDRLSYQPNNLVAFDEMLEFGAYAAHYPGSNHNDGGAAFRKWISAVREFGSPNAVFVDTTMVHTLDQLLRGNNVGLTPAALLDLANGVSALIMADTIFCMDNPKIVAVALNELLGIGPAFVPIPKSRSEIILRDDIAFGAQGGRTPSAEMQAGAVETFPILGQTAASIEPGNGAFDDPALGQDNEPVEVGTLDDFDVDLSAGDGQTVAEFGTLVATVGVELEQERIQAEQSTHRQHAAVAVLHVGGMHDGLHQQALRVDQDMPLLAFDLFPGVVTRRIDRTPPFSVLLTLWLSMIATVGLACRPAISRHATYSA